MTLPDDRPDDKPIATPPVRYGRGFHDWENQDIIPFRWMGREAEIFVAAPGSPDIRCLTLAVKHLFADQPAPRLEVFLDGRSLGQAVVPTQFSTLFFPFSSPAGGEIPFTLRLDRTHSVPGDGRALGIMIQAAAVIAAGTQDDPVYGAGWHGWETEGYSTFRWMGRRGEILLPWKQVRAHRYLTIPVFLDFPDIDQTLTLSVRGRIEAEWPVIQGWGYCSYDLARLREMPESEIPPVLELSVDRLHPVQRHAGDGRELGIRIGPLEFHDDDAWHADSAFFRENARKNYEEMKAGKTVLSSYPLSLGVDLFGRCNINPPCVYCLWDGMKEMEGDRVDAIVDDATLKGYGPFFRSARYLINCSFGEPLLHPRLAEILNACAERKKIIELSSNGQAFTDRTIKALVGKPVNLYVSLDAATRETYAKIRNDRWDDIVPSLVRLNEERQKAGRLPRIYLVFIPMRVNAGDLEEYFRLARRIEADKLVLRPLLHPAKPKAPIERGGYRFDFAREPLGRKELEALFRDAQRFARQYGVPLASQFDFGKPAPSPSGKEAAS